MTEIKKSAEFPVMEHYYTLQGEGFHAGKAAYFVRLGGCDIGCVWCDVKESWNSAMHPSLTIDEIVALPPKKNNGNIVVLTGGEPASYDLTELCDALHIHNFKIHIETSGAYLLQGEFDWITLSPKKFKPPLDETLARASELKVVIYHKSDFEWAEQNAAKVTTDCKLFLQPEWSNHEKNNPLIIDYVMQNPQWRLSLQTHKYINIA